MKFIENENIVIAIRVSQKDISKLSACDVCFINTSCKDKNLFFLRIYDIVTATASVNPDK
jgi:hypothetical protein